MDATVTDRIGKLAMPCGKFKGEFIDAVYLQQNAFDKTDEATTAERQLHVYALIEEIIEQLFEFNSLI